MSASADVNGATASSAVASPVPTPLGRPVPPPPPGNGAVNLVLNAPAIPVAVGSTFQVPVVLSGGTDIASVPMQVHYDPAKLSIENVIAGPFLAGGGQVPGMSHRDDGAGSIFINTSRPPGSPGVNGNGVVCILSFKAKAAGDSLLTLDQPGVVNSQQQPVTANGSKVNIVVK
jgi:general secretion pathway protein D